MPKIGVLLTNTGTPDSPAPHAVRRYLQAFLSDRRVVKIPRLIWLPILYGVVLTVRPYRSAKLYQKIWTKHGSPMRFFMQQIQTKLNASLNTNAKHQSIHNPCTYEVELGMNYGSPSIFQGLENLRQREINHLIVLPLYPQYSNTTTASTTDKVFTALKKWSAVPEFSLIRDYADEDDYINALSQNFSSPASPSRHLLISFHGIPQRFIKMGDPYQARCETTAHLLAKKLNLPAEKWTLCYQSRFGYDEWLAPGIQTLLQTLPKQGTRKIDVICPGFSVDCLETLEEIAIRNKKIFLASGGESFRYLPALNDSASHIHFLSQLIKSKSGVFVL